MTKQYTLSEALAWMVEHPGEVLIGADGYKIRLNATENCFEYFSKIDKQWKPQTSFPPMLVPFTHPAPKLEAVTLATLGRFRRVFIPWPEWASSNIQREHEKSGIGWSIGVIDRVALALQMGLDVTGEVE